MLWFFAMKEAVISYFVPYLLISLCQQHINTHRHTHNHNRKEKNFILSMLNTEYDFSRNNQNIAIEGTFFITLFNFVSFQLLCLFAVLQHKKFLFKS